MELAEQLGAEEWHTILERFFEILTEGVHRFEGTVNQYTGDGIMSLLSDSAQHRKFLTEAHRLFSEMGATGHAERTATRLAEVS